MIKYLVEHVAEFQSKDKNETLIWAIEKGHLEIIQYLVEHGADVNAKDKYNNTALNLVAKKLDAYDCFSNFPVIIPPSHSSQGY